MFSPAQHVPSIAASNGVRKRLQTKMTSSYLCRARRHILRQRRPPLRHRRRPLHHRRHRRRRHRRRHRFITPASLTAATLPPLQSKVWLFCIVCSLLCFSQSTVLLYCPCVSRVSFWRETGRQRIAFACYTSPGTLCAARVISCW